MRPPNTVKDHDSTDDSGYAAFLFWAGFLGGVACLARCMARSNGSPLDDEIGHYLISRDYWLHPCLLLDTWGKCINTSIYLLPAHFGLTATRLASVLMTCLTAWIAYATARKVGARLAYFVPTLFFFQPWVINNSYGCITEVPFSLVMALGLFLFVGSRPVLGGLMIGLLPLIRHEALALAGLWFLVALLRRRLEVAAAVAAPMACYILICLLVTRDVPLFAELLSPKPTNYYGSGGWLHFIRRLPASVGLVLLLSYYGLPLLLNDWRRAFIAINYAFYFAIHTVIYKFGLFASGGYVVFLLPISAMLAWVAAFGVESLASSLQSARTWLWTSALPLRGFQAVISAVILIGMLFVAAYGARASLPHKKLPVAIACGEAAAWVRDHGFTRVPFVATNVWFYHELPLPITRGKGFWVPIPESLERIDFETIVVWDRKYSDRWGLQQANLQGHPAVWEKLASFGPGEQVALYRRLSRSSRPVFP